MLSVRWKLVIPFLLIALLVVGLLLPAASELVSRRVEAEADRRLGQIAESVALLIENSEERARLSADFVANLPEVESAGRDEGLLGQVLVPRRDALALQELSYYSSDFAPGSLPVFYGGPVVARRLQVSQHTTQVREALVQQALATGQAVSGMAIAPQSSQIIGAAPVRLATADGMTTHGVVLAVFYLDDAFTADVSRVLGAEVAVVKDNAVIVSTIDKASGYELLLQRGFIDPLGGMTSRNLEYGNGIQERLLAGPLILNGQPEGSVLVAQDIKNLFQVRQELQTLLAVFAGVIVLATLAFGVAVIVNFAQPLASLAQATHGVSLGKLEQRVKVTQIGWFKDEITELGVNFNAMTERLQDLYNNLEAQVQTRTRELVEERNKLDRALRELAVARDQALEASRAKSTFLANMSHELRTPMNAIIGYSEMLAEEAAELGQEDFVPDLQKILAAGKHLLGLINDILDLSKIEAGRMELYLETFDLQTMIHDVATTIQPLVAKKANTLKVEAAPHLGVMRADLTKVRQALFNLLSNASKFTENGTITLTVQRESDRSGVAEQRSGGAGEQESRGAPLPGDWIIFSVSDTGIGMTPEQMGRLFQAFTQADASTTRKFGGTGLGLTITRHFCQMMGGDVIVESEPGQGTTFIIRLPAEVREKAPEAAPAGTEAIAAPPQNGACTVLVIDDEPTVGELMKRYLNKEGYRAEVATGGREGLRLARELRPDAITLDVMMPDMDGWAVLAALKSDPELADIPVIMLTIMDQKNLGYALGAADYLTKPIDRDRLSAVLHRYRCGAPECPILLVEDDAPTREMMRRTLEKEGWLVIEAENGRVGLERLLRQKPELILLDLMMPEMDGFEFVTHLRQREDWRQIPVVVVTAKELTPEDRLRLNGHVEKVLQKGAYSREALLSEVRDLVAIGVRDKKAKVG